MFSFMNDLSRDLLNPHARQFHIVQIILWSTYGLIFRLGWLGYDYVPPENLWFALYVIGGCIATYLLALIYWRIQKFTFVHQFLLAVVASVLMGMFWRFCFNYTDFHFLLDEPPSNLDGFDYMLGGTSSAIQLFAWSSGYLLISYYVMFKKERERSMIAELHAKEAQIKQLHQQVSPHFLFNVLHSLDTLLIKKNIDQSRDMISNLGQYLRSSLSTEPDASVPLVDEIGNARSYLNIEQMRFGDKLKVDWQLDTNLDNFMVPCLILQPLLENSIKHCIDKSIDGGQIEIRTERLDKRVFISVINTSFGTVEQDVTTNGLGIGLENIRARLEIYYGARATLFTHLGEEGKFTAIIKIGDDQ